jgi:hypothetical protein
VSIPSVVTNRYCTRAERSHWRHRSLIQMAAEHLLHMQKALDQMNLQNSSGGWAEDLGRDPYCQRCNISGGVGADQILGRC